MLAVQPDFDQGKIEVESYFSFLDTVDLGNKNIVNSNGLVVFTVDTELEKTLKANAFLLLYNLIEATIRNGLWEIHTSIQSEGADYKDLEDKIKAILVGDQVKPKVKNGVNIDIVTKAVCSIVEKILNYPSQLHPVAKRKISIKGGNLDIDTIQNTFKGYGISNVAIRHNDQEQAFTRTKENRNHLAHGNLSFNDCGKNYSLTQLINDKDEIFEYLQRVLDEIDSFITTKRYKKSAPIALPVVVPTV